MEGSCNQEKSSTDDKQLETQLLLHHHDHDLDHKGGMKTMPFIIVNEGFERLASYGLTPNLVFYLIQVYHLDVVTSTTILSIWSALSNGLSILGAFVSDSYLGRFRVIALGSLFTLLGMTFLWLTSLFPQLRPSSCDEQEQPDSITCAPPTPTQLAFLYAAFGLLSIGSGCIRPCSIAFGADQLKHNGSPRLIDSYLNWYYASITISTFVGITVLVYVQDQFGWQVGFAVAVFVMLCSTLIFLLGSSLYVKVKVSESLFSRLLQVLVVAFKNRKINLRHDDCYHHNNGMDPVELTQSLTFLNKACVVRNSNTDPRSFSTVENVEALKSLIRILPVWSSGILMFTTTLQSFPTLQAETMNRYVTSRFQVPAASFTLFVVLTLTLWIVIYDRVLVPLIAKHTHQPRGIHPKTRMGIGLLITVMCMVVSAVVESIRREAVEMSAMWLVPQNALIGLAEGFNAVGQMEFYYSELPNTMPSVAMAMLTVNMAVAGLVGSLMINVVDSITSEGGKASWLSSNLNEGHLDYYYWLLSFLNLLNFFYFVICWRLYRSFSSATTLSHEHGEEESVS